MRDVFPCLIRLRGAAAVASFALTAILACASSAAPPPKPIPPDPAEQVVAGLTASLKLDAAQQQRTRELLKALNDRNDRIREGWSKGERVQLEPLVASQMQFETDFQAMLTPEQRRTFAENRRRLVLQSRGVR
jgi:Spy/CpxP family protein refolding chaperone